MDRSISVNVFVFVVCGAKEHIDTLLFSYDKLKKHTQNSILIVTDNSRNEEPLTINGIIDIKTPAAYTNHQASIYLKTALHKILPQGKNYCYLDSDVIAMNNDCDHIFDEFIKPIRFAPDHCDIRTFSPIAVDCGCPDKWKAERILFRQVLEKYDKNLHVTDEVVIEKRERLKQLFKTINQSPYKRIFYFLRYYASFSIFRLDQEFLFDKKNKIWKDSDGRDILYEDDKESIEAESGVRFDEQLQLWIDKSGKDIWKSECDHLAEKINETFGINITERFWQHWNGGVFLFNDSSYDFLESWHKKTMEIFGLPEWSIRDQGTLIATAWEFGLQDMLLLDKKWNFLADDNNPRMSFNEEGFFTENDWDTKYKVNFVHIYHRFGDTSWPVWNFAANKS